MQNNYLGLDVSKKKIDCALLIDGGFRTTVIDNTPDGFEALENWLNKYDANNIYACCEATNVYWEPLATYLCSRQKRVSVVNPLQIKHYGKMKMQRGKTDVQDARLIARYCESEQPRLWQIPEEHESVLIALTRNLEYLKVSRVAELNRVKVAHDRVKPKIELMIQFMDDQIKLFEMDIESHIEQHDDLNQKAKLLESIPSIGKATVPFLLSLFVSAEKFQTGKQAVAFAGLSPQEFSSGSSVRKRTKTSKIGRSDIRKALYMPAVVAYSRIALFKPFVTRLQESGKLPKVIIVAIMRKLLMIAYSVLQSGLPFDVKRYS